MIYQTTKSFDSPVSSMDEDLLDRWRLAMDVYTVISETKPDWSCRIGIFGKWGEGKTSVMKFVESQAKEDGLICLWLNPSQVETSDGLWQAVVNAFRQSLMEEQIRPKDGWLSTLKFWVKRSEPLDHFAELNKYAKAIVGSGRAALKDWLRETAQQMRRIRENLHSRVVVFIDDLDRTRPNVVPTLLLELRELLDLPGFVFVVAFDDEIVSQTLLQVNSAWADGHAFLDKVLDFSFALPATESDKRFALTKFHIQQSCKWMDLEVVEQNSKSLPATPRKVKALIRNFMTIASQIRRHETDEIPWIDVLMGQIVRLESSGFLDLFFTKGHQRLIEVGANMPRNRQDQSFENDLREAIKECGVTEESLMNRLLEILMAWSTARTFFSGKHLSYFARLGTSYRFLTYKECEAIDAKYREANDIAVLESELAAHARSKNLPLFAVRDEFVNLLLEARANHLVDAAENQLEPLATESLAQAHQSLELINIILSRNELCFTLTHELLRRIIANVVGQVFYWIHFDKPLYQPTRKAEEEFLTTATKNNWLKGFEWVELLSPYTEPTSFVFREGAENATRLIAKIRVNLKDSVLTESILWFSVQGAWKQLYGPKRNVAVHFCFFDPNSPVWQADGIERFFALLKRADDNPAISENAFEVLSCLTPAARRDYFAARTADLRHILLLPNVAKSLWVAANKQHRQDRFLGNYSKLWHGLISEGVEAVDLPRSDALMRQMEESD